MAPGGGLVYAVEAMRPNFQLMNANVALNGLKNVYTFNAAAVEPVARPLEEPEGGIGG